MKLSVIIPTFNELKNNYVQKSFPLLAELSDTEVIIVDSHSEDGTAELALKYGFNLIHSRTNSRAVRIKEGVKKSKGDIILLHHPRSLLTIDGLRYLIDYGKGWGAFKHQFDSQHWLLSFTSFWSNYGRGSRGIFYLDHCIFFERRMKGEIENLKEVDIFEDTEICKILRRISKPELLPFSSTTSAVRFNSNGVFKQAYLNQKLKIQYYLGTSHGKMNKNYEDKLNLNSKYESSGN